MAAGGKKKKKKLSPEERKALARQRAFKRQARTIFIKTGFERVPEVADKEFEYQGTTSDFDDLYVSENIIVLLEYTLSNESGTGEHFKNKAHLYKKIMDDPAKFIKFLLEKFPTVGVKIRKEYHASQLRLRIAYFSEHEVKPAHSELAPNVSIAWRGVMQYFRSLCDTVERSARHELFHFLNLDIAEVGEDGNIGESGGEDPYPGSLLPEAHSEYPDGYKLVSFYVTPAALLKRAYVLRRDGWRDAEGLYQRMIDKKKIRSIRNYLKDRRRVFVNNVVVTLPSDTRLDNQAGEDVDPVKIDKTTPVTIKLRNRPNSIGIIDGQHRIFSYFEGVNDDAEIAVFRSRQNMLATGIIYPPSATDEDRQKFEAEIFLEINSNQNSAKSDLKQAILVITKPFSDESIGKRIIGRLAGEGALEGLLQKNYFETGVLKTSSMVSFALARLVRIEGDESLYKRVNEELREKLEARKNVGAVTEYVDFCAGELRQFLGAARAVLGSEKWAIKKPKSNGVLSVTSVNALIILFRKIVVRDGIGDFDVYRTNLNKLSKFDFSKYHSSQYNRMADEMLSEIYGK